MRSQLDNFEKTVDREPPRLHGFEAENLLKRDQGKMTSSSMKKFIRSLDEQIIKLKQTMLSLADIKQVL